MNDKRQRKGKHEKASLHLTNIKLKFIQLLKEEIALAVTALDDDLRKKMKKKGLTPFAKELLQNDVKILCNILHSTEKKNNANIFMYLKKKALNKNSDIRYKHKYETFITLSLSEPVDWSNAEQRESMAGWMIKEINTHADEVQTNAYLKLLQKIWFKGELSKEMKKEVYDTLEYNDHNTCDYGLFSTTAGKIKALTGFRLSNIKIGALSNKKTRYNKIQNILSDYSKKKGLKLKKLSNKKY